MACLAEAGAQGTGLREIGRRVNASPGLLRHYFDGKQDLMRESCKVLNEQFLAEIVAILESPHASPEDRLDAYVSWYFDACMDDWTACGAYIAFLDLARTEPGIREVLTEHRARHHARLAMTLREAGLASGDADPEHAAACAVAILNGLWLDLCCPGEGVTKAQAQTTARICLNALLSDTSPRALSERRGT